MKKLSRFGEKYTQDAGILSLMEDLGNALAHGGEDMIMMGGGNPGHIPEVEELLLDRIRQILEDRKDLQRLIGIYDPPQGEKVFIGALARLLNKEFGWDLTEKNIALTNGSQSAFFMLFNMLAGEFSNGSRKTIHFPLAPEYIGYADAGLTEPFFTATPPRIEMLGDHQFKYRVDFEQLKIDDSTAALCVSRPTNPTGNVLTDDEIRQLDRLCREADIPLIIDSAYGTPFPNLVYTEATPFWNENIIVLMSLSKLGMPAARTGIVIANEETIQALASVNSVLNLTTGSFGALLAQGLVESGDIIRLSNEKVRPYYQKRATAAAAYFESIAAGLPYRIHRPEGAMFLWFWFENLPISSMELYQRLKDRGVLVVSGHYFFPGIEGEWQHMQECLRVTYTQEEEKVQKGLEILAEEVRRAYQET